jgi:hypothetical protein
MIYDLLGDFIRLAPESRILLSGHNHPRGQSGPRRRESGLEWRPIALVAEARPKA